MADDTEADHIMLRRDEECSLRVTETADAEADRYLLPEEEPFEDCQILLDRIADELTGLAIINSKSSNADNLFNIPNLHHGYDNLESVFSQESLRTLQNDLAQVESYIEYFKNHKKNKPEEDLKQVFLKMINRIKDGLARYENVLSENSNADNQLNVANQHNRYINATFKSTLENVLTQVNSLLE